ncbi:MAG: Orotidine 5'-phosphate decarboxylase [Candidatus Wolfebacteria bacterium GW2011_GWE1_48_7]|uniref:Orotidine 5'-phosphate decarboxylase n=1 Tax=Candidatus Wolfebacteria bacterium GW2011_GWB1_47_1 TaxID=1619007 RepID=A0A0G4AQW4_9BACT|nr:MAG: orotidine 5'-phosphate decarboxylase, orotidine-5'-phosphate decarboxylase [Candidatus Wolfebacteria bacterium GW2011_GWB1_47_1]KKU37043.1 MAG: Orotidine 5'-phosphate decarboxylase [Candidatus Wolfebacteria bacterium GW2011_GWC2_46_275]KKU42590.1 MAG: Orotidine 5'-phosphate decarboxylase [Candidatus Wolfebacteria bacterium GW2011_GWB2_46_69]KKU54675.1 MAG: Orotidine 5'-phosphate decarboxylase [Candidatus Wolfebacteria bacterium GW2011_GWC1_47_103]KKU59153.1 MAG: Orotidine 5'-phosphate d
MQKNIRNTLFNPEFPAGFFLDPSEQEQLVAGLVYYDMIKMDNSRRLPLANGGLTDIYINIRESRKFAEGVAFLSDRYAVALKRLGVNRIADVPLAVSNLSGSIQERLGIPAITIREEAKPGRATQGVIIGDMRPGEIIGMYDDVMTDGKSKIKPYYAITAKGGTPYLVIMVDRMQGWRQKFTELGINLPTWAGTDLHTVRRHLINTFGLMQRCEPEMEEKNPFIWALDGMDWDTALPLMDILRPTGAILKMNNLLHNQERSHIVRDVHTYGRTMIDFKGSDTPDTIYNTCLEYRNDPPWAVTVHANASGESVRAAVRAFEGTPTKVLAITVLTSIDEQECDTIYHCNRNDEVATLATIGKNAGCHGFVCSGNEVRELASRYPGNEFVVPGTRSPGAAAGSQKNIVPHEDALASGATKLVAGSQFTKAADPVAEFNRVMTDELGIKR